MPTGNEDIYGAIAWAVNFCNDEDHGYKLGGVLSSTQPDTDCSGLIYYSLKANGFDVPDDRWSTYDMPGELRTMGFLEGVYPWGTYSNYNPQYGDICVYRVGGREGHGHAFFYAENVLGFASKSTPTRSIIAKARVEAIHDYDGEPGDSQEIQGGAYNEVWVNPYYGLYDAHDEHREWHVFRWGDIPPGPPPSPDDDALIIAGAFMTGGWTRKRRRGWM